MGGNANGGQAVHPSRRNPSAPAELLGALDLGTNNCRLLIAEARGGHFTVIDGFSRIVRLGEGVSTSGLLSDAAMDRAIDALRVCATKLRRRRVARARLVATEACRRAANGAEFLHRVEARTGLVLDVISASEEAALTLIGCVPLLDRSRPYALLFDVGGGSAELVWIKVEPDADPRVLGMVSLPCGVVGLTERNGSTEFTPDGFAALVAEIAAMLRPFEEAHGIRARVLDGSAQVLGTAGTVTTLSGMAMGLRRYERARVDGSVLPIEALRAVSGRLVGETIDQRAAHPCIGRGRADLVVAGCAVLEAVCRTWPAREIRVADRGLREGILCQLTNGWDVARIAGPDLIAGVFVRAGIVA